MNGAQPFAATSSSWLSWPHGRRLIIAVAAVVCVSLVLAMRNSQVRLRSAPPFAPRPPFNNRCPYLVPLVGHGLTDCWPVFSQCSARR